MKKLTKESPITLIELPSTQFGVLNGDISYDIYSKTNLPSRAIHVLEGILRYEGWKNTMSLNPFYHGKKGKLTLKNFERIFNSEVLMISSITRTSLPSMQLAKKYKQINPEGIIIVGGPDPTFRTEDWLDYADIIVKREGEKVISELMNRLMNGSKNLENKIVEAKTFLTSEELNNLPPPFYDRTTQKAISTSVIETSRGCPNDCNFCGVTQFYGRKYRTKSIDYVLAELERTKDFTNFRMFIDDNLIGNPKQAIRLFEAITENKLNKKNSIAQVTVKLAENPELMESAKKAGIKALCIGIESINDENLKKLGKPYSAKQNKESIKTLRDYGFWIHGMMMIGEDGDDKESYKETVEWMNNNLDSMQLFAITPLPGTRLYKKMDEQGRILSKDWSLYDAQNVLIRPKNFTPYELQKKIFEAYENFYSVKNSLKRLKISPMKLLSLEILAYTHLFGGIKKVLKSSQTLKHLEFLKSIS